MDNYIKLNNIYNGVVFGLNTDSENNTNIVLPIKNEFYTTYLLNISESRWKFRKDFDETIDLNSLSEKIWFVKKTIRYKTQFKQARFSKKLLLPPGLNIITNTGLYDGSLMSYMKFIFDNYKELEIPCSEQPNRGLTYLFTTSSVKEVITKDFTIKSEYTLNKLKKYCNQLHDKILDYIRIVCNYYKISEKMFIERSQIILLKYEHNAGIWLHIDNITRYDQGPIITFSIGPKKIYYDFTPSLVSDAEINKYNYKPLRVEVSDDDIVIMDGPARMEWAHGLPYKTNYSDIKYTIMLKCDKFSEKFIKHNDILDVDIYQSGL